MPHFELIIIGTGVAGRTAAEEAASAGLNTAIIDCRPFGGSEEHTSELQSQR